MSDSESTSAATADEAPKPESQMPEGFDPKQTHVAQEWKYTSPLICCRFDPQGRFLFTSAEDTHVQRWGFPTGELTTLEGHDSWVRDIVFLPDGNTVVTVGCDEQMMFWETDAEKPQPTRKIKAHQGWIRCADVSPDGKMLVTGGNDHLVKLWDSAEGKQMLELAGHESQVYSVMFHPDGQSVLSGDLSGQVKQWEVSSGKQMRSFDAKDLHSYNSGQKVHYGGVRSLSLNPDATRLACGGLHKASNPLGAINEPLVVVFESESEKQVRSHVADGVRGTIWRSFYLPDGTILGASGGSGGGFLLFWNQGEDKNFHQLKLKDTARGLDIHPDHLQLATVHWDRHVRISRMSAKQEKSDSA
jgi:WD40 repeat protein